MALFITSEQVNELIDIDDYIDVIERAYAQYGRGGSNMLPRIKLDAAQRKGFIKMLPASLSESGVAGIHIYTGGGRGAFLKSVLLFDIASGDLAALIESDRIGWFVPGAVSAVATKHLALKDASVLGIIGSGRQARAQALALARVRNIELIKVYSPVPAHREEFCSEMKSAFGLNAIPVESSAEAVQGSHIISTATSSRVPVFDGRLVPRGAHINAIGAHDPGRRELDTECVAGSRVVVDSLDRALLEEGELLIPMEEGRIGREHVYGELGEIAAGKKAGREGADDITLFLSGATAIEYVAVAAEVYGRAKERGVGQQLSLAKDRGVPASLYRKVRNGQSLS